MFFYLSMAFNWTVIATYQIKGLPQESVKLPPVRTEDDVTKEEVAYFILDQYAEEVDDLLWASVAAYENNPIKLGTKERLKTSLS